MNLNSVTSGALSFLSPWIIATIQRSSGSITAASGHRTPSYSTPEDISVKVQPLSAGEISQISGLNLQGEKKGIYISGVLQGASRAESKGGDLVTLQDASKWLVVHVLERWPEWSKVVGTRQI